MMMTSLAITHCGLCWGTAVASLDRSQFAHQRRVAAGTGSRVGIRAQAADEEDKTKKKDAGKEKKTSLFTSITDALDFAQTRSEKDAELLADAREVTQSGEKMNREQYAALRRKIGGTYKDFFKDSVDVIGDYVDAGWVDKTCRVCKKDTSNDPRTKDSMGRYAHLECLEKEKSGNFFTRLFGK